ncbi:MAG TPA: hypothetical protein VHG93_24010 [Longimicrobium sp.]|nr:hypothetical protein [Longimicrobium sp.]
MALLAACGDTTGSGRDSAIMEFRRALDRWNALAADDYRMTVRRQGGMIGGAAIRASRALRGDAGRLPGTLTP